MSFELLGNVPPPEQGSDNWTFYFRGDNGAVLPFRVFGRDMQLWFKERVGRYPRFDCGVSSEHEDIVANLDKLESKLAAEYAKRRGQD